jgi:hypothetical protein
VKKGDVSLFNMTTEKPPAASAADNNYFMEKIRAAIDAKAKELWEINQKVRVDFAGSS